jgi:hypothetical protein
MVKYVNMSRLLYSHIFKYTVLEQVNLLYCATATVQSRIRDKKRIYKDSAISNDGNVGIVASQTAEESGQ